MPRRASVNLDLINTLRITVISLACICMVLMAARARRQYLVNNDHFTIWATPALLTAMAYVVVQESQQIGQPFIWWRLPMLAVIVLLTLGALWRSKV